MSVRWLNMPSWAFASSAVTGMNCAHPLSKIVAVRDANNIFISYSLNPSLMSATEFYARPCILTVNRRLLTARSGRPVGRLLRHPMVDEIYNVARKFFRVFRVMKVSGLIHNDHSYVRILLAYYVVEGQTAR